jgi:thiol-disulfide isomerase/thioredoxin
MKINQSLVGAISMVAIMLGLFVAGAKPSASPPFAQRVKAPPFPQDAKWLNTGGPMELKDLRGKFVLLDFWTYCCINCMHILPELAKLEQAYPKNLVVVGVHSAKFDTEQDSSSIAEAIQRYKIAHPVINDANHLIWDRFGVSAWPTVFLIDPEGYVVWSTSGEITFEQVDKVIKSALPYYRDAKLLDETPVRFDLESRKAAATPLEYPGKILADERGGRLFIADSNHNRIVIAKLDGTLLDVAGSGAAGRTDGDFASASFNQPQGMALRGDRLFVADTENHSIRRLDLKEKRVVTIAGTGRQNREPTTASRPADPLKTALSSPWDLYVEGEDLYIAMAGSHQIWKMRLDGSGIAPYSGNCREDIVDGPLLSPAPYQSPYASFAQPSGLAGDRKFLYVADSEGSSIRAVPLNSREPVHTIVGTARLVTARLFTFGDRDGTAAQTLMQHPLGIAYRDGQLYVADTYNHKIKQVDPATGATRTLAGTGKRSKDDAKGEFDEPGGLAAAGDKLFVADTNNHLIREIDLRSGRVSTLAISGLQPPKPPAEASRPLTNAIEEMLKKTAIRPENNAIRMSVELRLPSGYKITPEAPMAYRLDSVKDSKANDQPSAGPIRHDNFGKSIRLEKPAAKFEIRLPVSGNTGSDVIHVAVDYYYCREGAEGLCKVGSVEWTVPVELSAGADRSVVELRHEVK